MRATWHEAGPVPQTEGTHLRIVLLREGRIAGWDEGVLCADGGALGFDGARTSFLLPPGTYRRHEEGLDVPDDEVVVRLLPIGMSKADHVHLIGPYVESTYGEHAAYDAPAVWPPLEDGPDRERLVKLARRRRWSPLAVTSYGLAVLVPTVGVLSAGGWVGSLWFSVILPLAWGVKVRVRFLNRERAPDAQLRAPSARGLLALGAVPMALALWERASGSGLGPTMMEISPVLALLAAGGLVGSSTLALIQYGFMRGFIR